MVMIITNKFFIMLDVLDVFNEFRRITAHDGVGFYVLGYYGSGSNNGSMMN